MASPPRSSTANPARELVDATTRRGFKCARCGNFVMTEADTVRCDVCGFTCTCDTCSVHFESNQDY